MNKFSYRIYYIVNLVTTFSTILLSVFVDKGEGYEWMPIIPFVYFILFAFGTRLHSYSKQFPGMLILNFIMFIKYVLTNLFLCINQNYSLARYYRVSVDPSSFHTATILIVIEMLSVFATISVFAPKIYKGDKYYRTNADIYSKVHIGPVLFVSLAVCLGIVILNIDTYLAKSMIIFSSNNALTEQIESNNLLSLIFHTFNVLVFGILVNNCIVKYNNTNKRVYIVLSYAVLAVFTFLSISTSRLNMIIPFVLFILITAKRFGKFGIIFNISSVAVLVAIFSVVSIYKNPWRYLEGSTSSAIVLEFARGLQEYTSGILPMAIGLQAITSYRSSIWIGTFFNDILGAIPGIAGLINQEARINYYYNLYALGGSSTSQIIPMTVTSYAYFTPVLCFLLVDVCIVLMMWAENYNNKAGDTFLDDYQSLYLSFILAASLISNTQIVTGRFFVNFLPPVILLFLNRRVRFSVRRQ